MLSHTIAVFVPFLGRDPRGTPADRPLGRLALSLRAEGIELIFSTLEGAVSPGPGDQRMIPQGDTGRDRRLELDGLVAEPHGWVPQHRIPVEAGYVRVASLRRLSHVPHVATRFQSHRLPLVNTPALLTLCRDKLEFAIMARRSGLPVPETESDPTRMLDALKAWGSAYFKPRFGARGREVALVRPDGRKATVTTDQESRSLDHGELEDWFHAAAATEPRVLQRAVPLPAGDVSALSIRSLVQRDASGRWVSRPAVVRFARLGVAGNVAAGAEVCPLEQSPVLFGKRKLREVAADIRRIDAEVVRALDAVLGPLAPLAVEVGLDYVPDDRGALWVIEANDTPQGRLEHVARQAGGDKAWAQARLDAAAAPFRYLASRPPMLVRACAVTESPLAGSGDAIRLRRGPLGSFWPGTGG